MVTANTLSEVSLVPNTCGTAGGVGSVGPLTSNSPPAQCYDRDKQMWTMEADTHSETLRIRLLYKDLHNVPRNVRNLGIINLILNETALGVSGAVRARSERNVHQRPLLLSLAPSLCFLERLPPPLQLQVRPTRPNRLYPCPLLPLLCPGRRWRRDHHGNRRYRQRGQSTHTFLFFEIC